MKLPGRASFQILARLTIGLVLLALITPSVQATPGAPDLPTRLTGHVLPGLAKATRTGDLPPDQPIDVTVALRPRSAPALAAAALGGGTSAARGGWLSPQDVGRIYGPADSTVQALTGYLSGDGLSVEPVSANRLSLKVHGRADQVASALGVHFGRYRDTSGHEFYASDQDPRLPASLAGLVEAILGLDNAPLLHAPTRAAGATPGTYGPADTWTAYNFGPLYGASLNGTGQAIGVLGCDAVSTSDLATFDATFGLPAIPGGTVAVDGGGAGGSPESTLDVEWSHAIAPGAAIWLYNSPTNGGGCDLQGVYDGLSKAMTDNVVGVISISLGGCETALPASIVSAFETAFSTAASQGQSTFIASGDSGAFACDPTTPAVSYPASSAFATAVGGTTLLLNPDSTYASEATWGNATDQTGGGGGYSQVVARPSWQAAVVSGNGRGVPDVAYNGDPATGFLVEYGGSLTPIGGTSIGTPQWAGLAAIVDQAAGKRVGLFNPYLYGAKVAGAESSARPPYHDVTSGDNLYYSAAPGWDPATGWGSPNAANFVSAMKAALGVCGAASSAQSAVSASLYRVFVPVVENGAGGPAC